MEKCLICDKGFSKSVWNQKYCSFECKEVSRYMKKSCKHCSKEFKTKKKSAKYCSMICSSFGEGRRVSYECGSCAKVFYNKKSKAKYGYGKYCSLDCQNKGMQQPYWFSCKNCGQLAEVMSVTKVAKRKFCSDDCKAEYFNYGVDEKEVIDLYLAEEMTALLIAQKVGTNDKHIYKILKSNGVEIRDTGFGNKLTCKDGHVVRSHYERVFDNRLNVYNIEHEYEPRISQEGRFFADFKAGDVYVEIWGMIGWDTYDDRKERKIEFYKEHDLKLFEVYPEDFRDIDKKIQELKRLIS